MIIETKISKKDQWNTESVFLKQKIDKPLAKLTRRNREGQNK
jgi:hypothetical protein